MSDLVTIFSRFTWQSALDVLLVALAFFSLFRLFRGTQAVQLLRGVLILVLVYAVATSLLDLTAFGYLMRNLLPAILVAIPVIFQPEMRRALERLGRTAPVFTRPAREQPISHLTNELVSATRALSTHQHGAIIVLEGSTGLQEYIETGVRISSRVSSELLQTIFYPGTALHDGAVIIREDRISAAACVLPLSQREFSDSQLGTRHRAALGISEQSDCAAIVVSEETGIVSVARNGRMVRRLDDRQLTKILLAFFQVARPESGSEES
ncbi:MAG: TIGR00159 family protein [Anaerolineae bacterium]|nr:TIGR00159 family protein [Anaerolineae bacterium]